MKMHHDFLESQTKRLEDQLEYLSEFIETALLQHQEQAKYAEAETPALQAADKLSGLLGKQLQHLDKWLDLYKQTRALAAEMSNAQHPSSTAAEPIDWELLKRFMHKRETAQRSANG